MNLIELQNKIHAQNKELGWWDESRPFSTFVCLFHSELSEAMEGDRKGLMDDHLPEYPMFWVELSDFVIRCLDYLGSKKFISYSDYFISSVLIDIGDSRTEFLCELHGQVSEFSSSKQDPYSKVNIDPLQHLALSVCLAFEYAYDEGVDLHKIILEKVEYNKHRADHKRENRAKDGGKKY